ncbi:hypothetical protein [Nonomuraea rubra]|uniref:hypothetical protein n=1 Tax=Nonomuraea rubra TaxID=46180 RepID=UPI0031EFAC4D
MRSSDFERSRSVPACTNVVPCDSTAVASDNACMRTRSAIGVSCGSLYASASNSVSLSCASTYVTASPGAAVYPAGEPL